MWRLLLRGFLVGEIAVVHLTGEEFTKEFYRRVDAKLSLEGDTYRLRDKIKDMGGIFDRVRKVWFLNSEEDIQKLGGVKKDDDSGWVIPKKKRGEPTQTAGSPRTCPTCKGKGTI
jgi:hypothetical protein